MTRADRKARKLQEQCDTFNLTTPVGSEVLVKRDNGDSVITKTRSEAQVLSGHTAVIWLEGISGAYLLDRVSMSAVAVLLRKNAGRLGPRHPLWKGGKRKVERGHIRLSAGPDRHLYEHRVVVRDLMREWNFWGYQEIPAGFSVHHIDFREDHNCPENLLLLDHRIHQAFIKDYRFRWASGEFMPQPEAPDWVNE